MSHKTLRRDLSTNSLLPVYKYRLLKRGLVLFVCTYTVSVKKRRLGRILQISHTHISLIFKKNKKKDLRDVLLINIP